MHNGITSKKFSNLSATPTNFTLNGGCYGIEVIATWGGGSVDLKRQAADGSTFVSVLSGATAFTANGFQSLNLPNGTYQLTIATATAVYADITSIVEDQ